MFCSMATALVGGSIEAVQERRQNVRVRPAPDSAVAVVMVFGERRVPLSIIDVSIGGFGFLVGFEPLTVGQELEIEVAIPGHRTFSAQASVRHVGSGSGGDMGGVQLLDLTDEQAGWLRKYVAELFERGLMR